MKPFAFQSKRKSRRSTRLGVLGIVPWLNAGLIVMLLGMVSHHILVTPGTLVELSQREATEGLLQGQIMLVLPVERAGVPTQIVLFFDDDRYDFSDEKQMLKLCERVRALTGSRRELNVLVDRRVQQGDVMALLNLLRSSGVERINVVEKPA